jgi:hypothetical protein
MSHMGGSGRRRGRAIAALLITLCVAAPELGGVAAAATPSPSTSASAAKPTSVVLVARRRTRSQVERARFRAYLKRHPTVMKNQIKRHPNAFKRHIRKAGTKQKHSPYAAAVRKKAKKHKRKAAAKKKHRRRGAAVAGAAAAKRKKGNAGKNAKNNGDGLSWSDWAGIGLLILAPFAAVALLLYITDLRRRPRAPSRSKRRRSLVITPHKS